MLLTSMRLQRDKLKAILTTAGKIFAELDEDKIEDCISNRAGPQNEKWSNQQKTENPTGSIHQDARKKSLAQKKFILMRGFAFEKYGPCSKNAQRN